MGRQPAEQSSWGGSRGASGSAHTSKCEYAHFLFAFVQFYQGAHRSSQCPSMYRARPSECAADAGDQHKKKRGREGEFFKVLSTQCRLLPWKPCRLLHLRPFRMTNHG